MRKTRKLACLLASLAVAAVTVTGPSAAAVSEPEPPVAAMEAPAFDELLLDAEATVEVYRPNGKLVGTTTLGPETMGQEITVADLIRRPDFAGNPHDVSTNDYSDGYNYDEVKNLGCLKVTLHNKGQTLLGFQAYDMDIWTSWCFNNVTSIISDVSRGWALHQTDPFYEWQGFANQSAGFFAWRSGYDKSGYNHMKQGHYKNCPITWGCASYYPKSVLKSRTNGSFYWSMETGT